MQKVACPAITVSRLRSTPSTWVKVLLSATPVTTPGSAIGRTTRNEIVSRPKNLKRATANEATLPRSRAIPVATAPTLIDVQRASRAPVLSIASLNQWVVRLGGGHARVLPPLKA